MFSKSWHGRRADQQDRAEVGQVRLGGGKVGGGDVTGKLRVGMWYAAKALGNPFDVRLTQRVRDLEKTVFDRPLEAVHAGVERLVRDMQGPGEDLVDLPSRL